MVGKTFFAFSKTSIKLANVWEAVECTGVTDFLEVFGPYKELPKVGDAYNKVLTQAKQFNELAEGLMVKERIKIPIKDKPSELL